METKTITLTVKGKLVFDKETKAQDELSLKKTATQFMNATNAVSADLFNAGLETLPGMSELNSLYYHMVRDEYFLKSQMTQSVLRSLLARYKAVKTNLQREPWSFYDKEAAVRYKFDRDLGWLTEPIVFHTPFYEAVRNRDFTLDSDFKTLSLIRLTDGYTAVCHSRLISLSVTSLTLKKRGSLVLRKCLNERANGAFTFP